MDFAAIQEAIRAQIKTCLGITVDTDCVWTKTAKGGTWKNSPRCLLSVRGLTPLGWDENRTAYDVGTDKLVATRVGNRLFTILVRVEVDNQTPGADAYTLQSRLHTRLQRPTVLAALRAVNVALVNLGPAVDAEYRVDGRDVSAWAQEIRFSTVEQEVDAQSSGDYIKHVDLSSDTLKGADGEDLPDQMDKIVPPLP